MSQPLIAYQMIALVDQLNLITHKLIDPILVNDHCPAPLREQASALMLRVEALTEQTVDYPDVDRLQKGLTEIRSDFEKLMIDAGSYQKSF